MNKKVVLAISGGVDSSVSALRLLRDGYIVIGVFMRLGHDSQKSETAARKVCKRLKIKFYPVNLNDKFEKEIKKYFIDSYKSGITPNPCIKCNRLIKFGELLRITHELGADFLATGHYVRKTSANKRGSKAIFKLLRGADKNKDQSYFLYTLKQRQLKKILFPLGESLKDDIKKEAEINNLPNLKGESQDICFLNIEGKIVEHNEYLKKHISSNSGSIVDTLGNVVGKHQGLPFYTIGQRKGVEIGGIGPFYVVKTDYKTNTLHVTNDANDPLLFSRELILKEVNWISGEEPIFPFKCEAVIRYRHKGVECTVEKISKDNYKVYFSEPQRAVTPGQSTVFYDKDEVLGGGIVVG